MAKLFGWPWPLNISILADILRICYETRRKVLRAARSPPARSSTSSAGAGKLDEAKIRWLRRLKSNIDDFTRTTSSLISSPEAPRLLVLHCALRRDRYLQSPSSVRVQMPRPPVTCVTRVEEAQVVVFVHKLHELHQTTEKPSSS
ncbi:hypothetical protein B5807_07410 [Epicoccum nigrum]|uniref:Uncharacterized protein n=1 Tax=Epicoccum nigrum TaxID=105696 RepID=A0A1Y2LV56_EPING|nr:hypothetical protein B5807_07410 [Epicoccum nigrum]